MVEHDVVANDRGFTDDHARAVIDEETFSNLCARVNLDASGNETGKLRNQAWQKWDMGFIKSMGDAVVDNCPEALVDHCLEDIATGRVFLEDDVDDIGPTSSTTRQFTWSGYKYAWWQLWKVC